MKTTLSTLLMATWLAVTTSVTSAETVTIGSKKFTEQEILGEIIAQLLEQQTDLKVERRFFLGGTGVVHSALTSGQLDIYVEYTGTALLNVLNRDPIANSYEVYRLVSTEYREQYDLEWLPPIGFDNTYAITVREQQAKENDWQTVSDLAEQADQLDAGFPSEFMERPDGYRGLRKIYDLEFEDVSELDPGLMYLALSDGQVDVISAFATDGRIEAYKLKVLEDDKGLFPPYDAAPVVRIELLEKHPEIRDILSVLAGTINAEQMRRLNYEVDELKKQPATVAAEWIEQQIGQVEAPKVQLTEQREGEALGTWGLFLQRQGQVWQKLLEHIALTGLAIGIAVGVGVPTGVVIYQRRRAVPAVLTATEIVQTVPSLAMLAFLFALYRSLGLIPAVTALVLYALLPIVVNTFTGLRELPADILEAADSVGMSKRQKLFMVELPLALPVIVAGVRTSTVWTVGIATLSTYIGAGGLGDFIARGLARNDSRLTLLGAIPAALLAVTLSLIIRGIERYLRKG